MIAAKILKKKSSSFLSQFFAITEDFCLIKLHFRIHLQKGKHHKFGLKTYFQKKSKMQFCICLIDKNTVFKNILNSKTN